MAIALRRPREDELLVSVFAEYVSDERIEHQDAFCVVCSAIVPLPFLIWLADWTGLRRRPPTIGN